nr:MAG TPA: DNA gyrase subunit A [Caudoviricetes sp.]
MKEKLFCKICGKELQGSQRLYCSNSCKQKGHYQE